ncbi:MAG: Na/Pi cotransporter family protein, partial [Ignavibacteriae bacterium]|nr:Na/Pi cotransporter family protein [Ignavibacteriota bacterium]
LTKTNGDVFNAEIYYTTVNQKLAKPFSVKVQYKEKPLSNIPVHFELISIPPKDSKTKIYKSLALTDTNGIAQTEIQLGSQEGEYEFSARIKINTNENDIVYLKAFARNSNWVFFLVSGLIGGLALFLFGMNMMSEGMKKTAGAKLRVILETLTHNKLIAVAVGAFITMIIQSSSATTVMLVSFVQAQLMTFAQTLGIILGAGIGTTITTQLIAFKLTDYSLIVIGLGFAVFFFAKSKKYKSVGELILGFGILFYGMYVMSNAMYPLRTYQPFINVLMNLENPFLGIIVGTIFTALIQSSAAFAGIIIILGTQGLISLDAAIPLILGANIGTSVTAILASFNAGREAKKVAFAHTLFKVIGVLLFIWWIPDFAKFVRSISPGGDSNLTGVSYLADVLPRQIANAHTVFNVVLALILLPFTNMFAKLIEKILPKSDKADEEGIFKTRFLEESLISTPTLALNLAKAEIIRMALKAQKMVENIIIPFLSDNEKIIESIEEQELELNFLNDRISKYLIKIGQESLQGERADEVFQMMHCVTELEAIGDVVSKRLLPRAKLRLEKFVKFSAEGKTEIEDYHLRTMKQISRAVEVLKEVNLVNAKRMEKKYKKYRLMEMELRRTHFERIRQAIPESIESDEIHLDLIDSLKRISSNATNIARIFLELKGEKNKNQHNNADKRNNSDDNKLDGINDDSDYFLN